MDFSHGCILKFMDFLKVLVGLEEFFLITLRVRTKYKGRIFNLRIGFGKSLGVGLGKSLGLGLLGLG